MQFNIALRSSFQAVHPFEGAQAQLLTCQGELARANFIPAIQALPGTLVYPTIWAVATRVDTFPLRDSDQAKGPDWLRSPTRRPPTRWRAISRYRTGRLSTNSGEISTSPRPPLMQRADTQGQLGNDLSSAAGARRPLTTTLWGVARGLGMSVGTTGLRSWCVKCSDQHLGGPDPAPLRPVRSGETFTR